MCVGVVNRVLDGRDFFCIFVWYLNAKLVFECHHQFNRVKRVCAQIGNKRFFAGDLAFFNAQLFSNDFLNT